jgi:methionyl aminopeptidase
MWTKKTSEQIAIMKEGGRILAAILNELADVAKPGMQTRELSAIAALRIKENNVTPSFLGYRVGGREYPDVICLSVNSQCVHTPGSGYMLQEGDLLKLDFGVIHKGLHTDSARTVLITNLDKGAVKEKTEYKDRRQLIAVTRECLEKAITLCRPDGYLGDIGYAIQSHAEHAGFSVARELGGHGIGHSLHEEPWVANFGKAKSGLKLAPGMVLAIEPIINMGTGKIGDGDDGFTYETSDGSLSAHFEHTIAITEKGPEVLTH